MNEIFTRNFVLVFFLYGLSFFSMGLAVLLEVGRSSELEYGKSLRPLGFFGLIHGAHEWYEMFLIIYPEILNKASFIINISRILLLAISFMMLLAFGAGLIIGSERLRQRLVMMSMIVFLWLLGLMWVNISGAPFQDRAVASDVYTRYSLAIPGASLTAWGLLVQRRKFSLQGMQTYGRDLAFASLAFLLYGVIGQLFAAPSLLFPSVYLNWDTFSRVFGFPVQAFRGAMAAIVAFFIIRSLRAFEAENLNRIGALREAQLTERRRLEELRAELLHRTVKAQESERQRIARELHDQTGQTITALGMGLRGLAQKISSNPDRAVEQALELEALAVEGTGELQRMVTGLRPPQLDDLGLLAALRWCADDFSQTFHLPIEVKSLGSEPELSEEVRIVFFRIAQEALANIVRHANASKARVVLSNTEHHMTMTIEDDGEGFNADLALHMDLKWPNWGLLGMIERSTQIGADLEIDSEPGKGTRVIVSLEREG